MATLEAILTGADDMEIIESDAEPLIADGGPEGPWLVALRPQLQAALLSTPPGEWPAVAERWVATEELEGTSASMAASFLEELAGLARRASDRDNGSTVGCRCRVTDPSSQVVPEELGLSVR